MIPEPPHQSTETAELLQPVADLVESWRLVLGVAALGIILVLAGARLERYLLKRRLEVLDGEGDVVDVAEKVGGGRS